VLRPEMKVLFISGYSDQIVTRDRQLQDGVALLEKPFSPASLARKVRKMLDSAEQVRGRVT